MTDRISTNVTWHEPGVSREDLEILHGHKGATVWFTGLPSAGKSTIANAVARELHQLGVSTMVLDGDNVRHGLNKNLGFSPRDRVENVRRIGEVAKLFTDAVIVNLNAFISPYAADREMARKLQPKTFLEIYCRADIEVCEARDPKGNYKRARAGEIRGFTGVDAPYEPPENPELCLDTGTQSIADCASAVIELLRHRQIIK
ncbi:MAG: adenylyl-sulfate kinase [Myxococcota bacterium]|nr:adenylyl-sulfate kinase [Myxococcota bacterium]